MPRDLPSRPDVTCPIWQVPKHARLEGMVALSVKREPAAAAARAASLARIGSSSAIDSTASSPACGSPEVSRAGSPAGSFASGSAVGSEVATLERGSPSSPSRRSYLDTSSFGGTASPYALSNAASLERAAESGGTFLASGTSPVEAGEGEPTALAQAPTLRPRP